MCLYHSASTWLDILDTGEAAVKEAGAFLVLKKLWLLGNPNTEEATTSTIRKELVLGELTSRGGVIHISLSSCVLQGGREGLRNTKTSEKGESEGKNYGV